jgi:rubredoxin
MSLGPVEIQCPSCGKEALLLREPKYDGFTRVGETLSCSSCGHEFETEEDVPFKERKAAAVFSDEDRSPDLHVFEEGEVQICRHCRHYVINPFTQWCGVHKKEVEATDTCKAFDRKEEEEEEESPI